MVRRSGGRKKPQVKRKWWAHGCATCGLRYEAGETDVPRTENGRCRSCLLGHPHSQTELAYFPRECCWHNTVPMFHKRERERYGLAGPPETSWYRCQICCRTFPFTPPVRAPWVWYPELADDLKEEMEPA